MAIKHIQLTGTTDSETTDIIRGVIQAIRFDISATTPATADLSVAEAGSLGRTLATATDIAADIIIYPSVQLTSNAGVGVTGAYAQAYVNDKLTVSLAQGDADNVVDVYILWIPDAVSG
jgi:hypothetical protein